jgi:hypothetical protein
MNRPIDPDLDDMPKVHRMDIETLRINLYNAARELAEERTENRRLKARLEKLLPSSQRNTFHCEFGIRGIQKGKKGKPATMTVEVHNDLAEKLMQAIAGDGPKIYGPVMEWQEDRPECDCGGEPHGMHCSSGLGENVESIHPE